MLLYQYKDKYINIKENIMKAMDNFKVNKIYFFKLMKVAKKLL